MTAAGARMTVPADRVMTFGHSRVQHGRLNDRVYLMKLAPEDMPGLVARLDGVALNGGYAKIFARVPARFLPAFLRVGYREEARIPNFFRGRAACAFLGKYFDPVRARERDRSRRREILAACRQRAAGEAVRLPGSYNWAVAGPGDAGELARLYRAVFETYPFPIHDPAFIRRSMKQDVRYGCVRHRGRLVALCSADVSDDESTVEMTDFATLPEARGRRFARYLLARMEESMAARGILTAYTIARALSAAMNRTFAAQGYRYAGTLINNTQIAGALESMNVWYKPLRRA
ncbi:MAG: putative beta-lysine N-acetyltransferase [bacterium]